MLISSSDAGPCIVASLILLPFSATLVFNPVESTLSDFLLTIRRGTGRAGFYRSSSVGLILGQPSVKKGFKGATDVGTGAFRCHVEGIVVGQHVLELDKGRLRR